MGAGAAGGSGAVSTGTVSGGAGGNTGGLVKATFPAILIPDTLFIQVGLGGIGNITGTGGSGGISYVSIAPTGSIALPQTLVVASSTTVGLGGTGGSGTGANPPSAPTATTTAVAPFLSLGIFTALAGVQGGSALVGAAGTNINALGSTIVTGGAGGGGKTNIAQFDGGSILSASVILTSNVNGGASGTNAGGNGYGTSLYNSAICGTGGAGAGGQTTGTTSPGFGGGCGAVTKALFPANVLPDTLYIQPGVGAVNATATKSFVSIVPSSAAVINLVCTSGAAPAGNGANLQLGETAAAVGNANLLSLGTFTSVAGRNQPNTATVTPLTTTITCPVFNGR